MNVFDGCVTADIYRDQLFYLFAPYSNIITGQIGAGAGVVGDDTDLISHLQIGGSVYMELSDLLR